VSGLKRMLYDEKVRGDSQPAREQEDC